MYFKVCYHFENIFVFGSGKHFDDPPLFNFPACERLSSRILNLNSSFRRDAKFLNNVGRQKCLLPLLLLSLLNCGNRKPPFLNCALHVAVSGHRVKVEDPQKMQFSDRLSEIERYQRSMRIGTANNNPRPIHQAHLSTTQGELIHGNTIVSPSPNHPLSYNI